MRWRIQLLGDVRIEAGDTAVDRFESRHAALLLARVALFPARVHPREELAALLWPDADAAAGRARLRHVLSSLRRQFAAPGAADGFPLVADRHGIRLHRAAAVCDATEFESAARHGRADDARALYAGDLLPGHYDDWVQDERERLRALYDALGDPAPAAAPTPAPPTQAARRVLLPVYLTPFFGRDDEVRSLTERLDDARLVTLLGPGGCGKTRLATEAARALADRYDPIAFVPLAECPDPRQLVDRIRNALDLPADASALDFLDDRPALLILDNLEQLVERGAPESVAGLLARLPRLRCLATSRRALGVDGEATLPLAPLPTPESDAPLAEVAAAPSVALFVQRCRAARPDFQVTARNRAEIAALCQALEGLPLALELAASRIRALSVPEMRRQWDERFSWLARTGLTGDKETRHRSLAATLEWSWRLLPGSQQRFLAALSVFQGGWDADAARAVTGDTDARERLEALTTDSLLVSDEAPDGATRFRMLEMVRAFAAERCADPLPLRARHRAWYAHAGRRDAANRVRALETACEDADADAAYALFVALEDTLPPTVGIDGARERGASVLALPAPDPTLRLRAINLLAHYAGMAGDDSAARTLARQALDAAGDDPALRALALAEVGRVGLTGDESVETLTAWLEEARALAHAAGDGRTESSALRRLGILALRRRDWTAGESLSAQSQAVCEAIGDERGARFALANVAQAVAGRGDTARAQTLYETCLARARTAPDPIQEGMLLLNLGWISATHADWDAALTYGRDCVRLTRSQGNHRTLSFALWNVPEPMLHRSRVEDAVRLLAFAERFWTERFGALDDDDRQYLARLHAAAEASLSAERVATLSAEGRALPLDAAVALALG